ncbi:hypothetical protein QFZ77_006337 [Paenibacillus sp. V4I3]|uniref:hypothetical protein n=1 Tax=Paenibacillus sp. V4I3 TaxID=3042305 RepID=UPI0027895E13|nr:hypothetical protein [Paenibacillus sp. V4I3]MDQ0877678.1 hypothetical protein [Paenibacillus sp. V4I3]
MTPLQKKSWEKRICHNITYRAVMLCYKTEAHKEDVDIKKRSSIEKSEWSVTREESFEKYCFEIVFGFGDKLQIENKKVYVIKNGEAIEVTVPQKHKTFWYEAWLGLRAFYSID